MISDPTFAVLMTRLELIASDPTLEPLRTRLKQKEAELIKKLDQDVQEISQTPQTSPYKRHDLEILKILKDIRRSLSRTAS
jgi:hypothetical protein